MKKRTIISIVVVLTLMAAVVVIGRDAGFRAGAAEQTSDTSAACDCPACREAAAHDEDHASDQEGPGAHAGHEHDYASPADQAVHEYDDEAVSDEHNHEESAYDGHVREHQAHDDHVHEAHGHGDHEGHDDEGVIHLDPESRDMIGLRTITAKKGLLSSTIRLTGQIRMNEDRLAHIVPLTSGIVRQVNKTIGDTVKQDEILAWIESPDLAQAKVRYLDIQAEIGCCALLLDRAQRIHDNTVKLIEKLKSEPTLEELRQFNGMEMGDNRSRLLKAYAEYILAKSAYEREKPLYQQKIASHEEFLSAESRLKKAEADYTAALDTVQFQIKQDLLEAATDQQRQEIALKGVERTLYVLGQTGQDIQRLDGLTLNTRSDAAEIGECPDPDCAACREKAKLAALVPDAPEEYRRLGWYPLRSSFDGMIIDRHVTLGERLGEDTAAFTVADLETVWVDLDVYPRDLPHVRKGRTATIQLGRESLTAEIGFVSPVLSSETRTATARIILGNFRRTLRPGMFVTAGLNRREFSDSVVVPKTAVQTIGKETFVFVKSGPDYAQRPVKTGRQGAGGIEIVAGLREGEQIVTEGAFDLKARLVTSTLDPHAGHGH